MSLVIQKLRLQRGWSQQQLADFSGLSVRTVQWIENGQKATAESLKSLAAVFEVEFQELRAAVDQGAQPSPAAETTLERPDPAAMNADPNVATQPTANEPTPTPPPTPTPTRAPRAPSPMTAAEAAPATVAASADAALAGYRAQRLAMSDDEVRAFREVRKLRGFYHHLMIYVVVISGLTIFNLWKTPERLWVLGPALGWGIGILSHGLSVFGGGRIFGPEWERKQIEKRLGRKLALMLGAGLAFGLALPGDVWAQAQPQAMTSAAPSLGDVLVRVPVWVWAVFVVLLVVGLRLSRTSTSRPVVSMTVSLGLLMLSLSGVVSAFGAHTLPLAANAAYAPVMAGLLGALGGLFLARTWAVVRFARAHRGLAAHAVA